MTIKKLEETGNVTNVARLQMYARVKITLLFKKNVGIILNLLVTRYSQQFEPHNSI